MFGKAKGLRLTVGIKIAAILGVVTVPFAMMTGLYILQVAKDITFAQTEVVGAHYVLSLWNAAVASDPKAAVSALESVRRSDPAMDGALKSTAAVDAFVAALRAGDQAGVSAGAQSAISKVSDGSNLTLDPDLDSYYLMDAITVRLPEMRSALLGLLAADKMLEGSAKVNGAAIVAVVDAATRLRLARASAASSIEAAMEGNADGSVRKKLSDTVSALAKSGAASASAATTLVTSLQGGRTDGAKELSTALAAEIAAVETLWPRAQEQLVRLLDARIAGFESQRLSRMVIVSLCLFLTGVVLVLVIRSIRRPLSGVLTTIGRFQSGDFVTPVAGGDLNNEFGEIARALQRLQGMTGEHALTTAGLNGSGAMLMITDPNERIN
ncbi:MAG TPA: HAMP domain-containing protein, partial [Hyphomicrobium sp.]|nr:HAMP domain-containing protein [Hyphomicrobium sp.]